MSSALSGWADSTSQRGNYRGAGQNHCRAAGYRRHHTRPETENGRV